jgi:hypothetical protein
VLASAPKRRTIAALIASRSFAIASFATVLRRIPTAGTFMRQRGEMGSKQPWSPITSVEGAPLQGSVATFLP